MYISFDFIQQNVSIAEKTYYKMGGTARYFATPSNLKQIQETIYYCQKNQIPCAILGSGSNSVYADGFFNGLILSLEKMINWHWETEEYLFVEAGVTNTEIAEICLSFERAGASWMYRMPGQIGATVRMNARCYGGEISQIVSEIVTLTVDGNIQTYKSSEIFQGYKKTLLMDFPHVVVGVRLYFPKKELHKNLLKIMHDCENDRHSKHHFDFPSCGSTFKNNYSYGKSSGIIFDSLGLKGKQIGEAAVSKYHANFVWNKGNAKTIDMLNLTSFMRQEAYEKNHVNLELEVQPVGIFSNDIYYKCGMENLGPAYQNLNEKWVGLFYFPLEKNVNIINFPKKIFSSFFINYNQNNFCGRPEIDVDLIQLISLEEAKNKTNEPFLLWKTSCELPIEKYFPVKVTSENCLVNDFSEINLWEFSVSEIFFGRSNQPENYLEFEITPDLYAISLQFEQIRQKTNKPYKKSYLSFSEEKNGKINFGLKFTYSDLRYVLDSSNNFLFQCALSLGNENYLLAPYWKFMQHETPNFHQPEKFWLQNLY